MLWIYYHELYRYMLDPCKLCPRDLRHHFFQYRRFWHELYLWVGLIATRETFSGVTFSPLSLIFARFFGVQGL